MKARIIMLVAAATSLVLVAFLAPLAVLIRATAADRAISAAVVELETLIPVVATAEPAALAATIDDANARGRHRVSVFMPDGRVIGAPASRTAAVDLAVTGTSLTADAPGGREVVISVSGLDGGTAAIRTVVPDAELRRGVAGAWSMLAILGIGLLAISMLVAYQLTRAITRPLIAAATASRRLAGGDLTARAPAAGPPEVRQVSTGLNLLAGRIGELLAAERERVADLSHRVRTPLTALRIDTESLADPGERARLLADLDRLEHTVDAIIWQARRPTRHEVVATCDAAQVITERVGFWAALADEEQRRMRFAVPGTAMPVRAGRDDLAACVDILLGNVFTHTPEGTGMAVALHRRTDGHVVLVISDEGPGLPGPAVLRRGHSGSGSTGLGLDIVRRVAADSGGAVRFSDDPSGGARIVVDFGAPPPGAEPRLRRAEPSQPTHPPR